MAKGDNENPLFGMGERSANTAPRARNRTVMLTPELTNQMRAKVHEGDNDNGVETHSVGTFSAHPINQAGIENVQKFDRLPSAATSSSLSASTPFSGIKGRPTELADGFGSTDGFGAIHPSWGAGAAEVASEESIQESGTLKSARPAFVEKETPKSEVYSLKETPQPVQPVQSANTPSMHKSTVIPPETKKTRAAVGDEIVWVKETPVVGFLVSYDINKMGHWVELRAGRLSVSGTGSSGEVIAQRGNFFIIDHPSVSFNHAIMKIGTEGVIEVLDQLSDQGTRVYLVHENRVVDLSGEKCVLQHSDVIEFGERRFRIFINPLDIFAEEEN